MAAAPTNAKLMAIIINLQVQIAALQNAAPAAAVAPPAGAAPAVFADMPQMLGTDDLINYLAKRGSAIFLARVQGTQQQGTYWWLCHDPQPNRPLCQGFPPLPHCDGMKSRHMANHHVH